MGPMSHLEKVGGKEKTQREEHMVVRLRLVTWYSLEEGVSEWV